MSSQVQAARPPEPAILDPYGELFAKLGFAGGDLGARDQERMMSIRRQLVWAFSWAVPSPEAVRAIAACSPLIEIGAGTGYWAWLLKQAGADIVAYDRAVDAPPFWTRVERGGEERLAEHPERTLFLCWPPMGGGAAGSAAGAGSGEGADVGAGEAEVSGGALAADCLAYYRGSRLIVIGEIGEAARTEDARFRRLLAAGFNEERVVRIPQWPGFSDALRIYHRK